MAKIKTKRERVKFASDNIAGACPEVLDAILKANEGIVHHMEMILYQQNCKISFQ